MLRSAFVLLCLVLVAGCDSAEVAGPFAVGDLWRSSVVPTDAGTFSVGLDVEAVSGDRVSGCAEVTGGRDVGSAGTYPTTFSGAVNGDTFSFSTGEVPGATGVPDGLTWGCDVDAPDRMVCSSIVAPGVVFVREPVADRARVGAWPDP